MPANTRILLQALEDALAILEEPVCGGDYSILTEILHKKVHKTKAVVKQALNTYKDA